MHHLTPFSIPEGMPWVSPVEMGELVSVVEDLVGSRNPGDSYGGKVIVCKDIEDAMVSVANLLEEEGGDELVVVSGSLYLVADALRYQAKLEDGNEEPGGK